MPLDFGVLAVGNLTNAFAQSVSVVALVADGRRLARLERGARHALFAVVVTAAFLSHTSTFAILSVACSATAVALLVARRAGAAVPCASPSWWRSPSRSSWRSALYYAHFLATYRTELARIGAETATAAPDAGGRGIMARLLSVPRYVYLYFGVPTLLLAAWGARWLWRPVDRLSLAIGGWTLACGAFLALGILTPVDMRYYLAAIPVVALVAGLGASAALVAPADQPAP